MLDSGEIVTENRDILQEQYRFYADLYQTRSTEIDAQYIENIGIKKVLKEENDMLKAEITLHDVRKALWDMEPNKVPGSQGFPPEFFRHFWDELGQLFHYTIKEASQKGFSVDTARGITSLMEKENKNILKIELWRPLSLLNTDCKAYSKILANRLNPILQHVIHQDQSEFLAGRGLTENVFDLVNAIELCEQEKIDAILVNFDLMKAFDSVEWDVLFAIMKIAFGICDEFIDMTKQLFCNIQSCTVNFGHSSQYITLTRGVRQGDPLSSSLFLMIIEVLGQKIRSNENIHGIQANENHKKIGQYADDLWSLIKALQSNFDNLINEVEYYCSQTGLKVNYNKTQVVRINSMRNGNAHYYSEKPLIWSTGTKVLGISNPRTEVR